MKLRAAALIAVSLAVSPVAAMAETCTGYAGPGGPCSTGPGGGLYTGPGVVSPDVV